LSVFFFKIYDGTEDKFENVKLSVTAGRIAGHGVDIVVVVGAQSTLFFCARLGIGFLYSQIASFSRCRSSKILTNIPTVRT
jgi:hypothetical protein